MYKVWLHIEEIGDDGEALEPDIGLPDEVGEFDTEEAARTEIRAILAERNPAELATSDNRVMHDYIADPCPCADCASKGPEAPAFSPQYVCADPDCKEGIPTRSGSAYWDRDAQEWMLSDDMEDPYCSECNGEIAEEVPE